MRRFLGLSVAIFALAACINDGATGEPVADIRVDYDLGGQWSYMTLTRASAGTALLAGGYREGRIEPTDRSWIIHLPKRVS